MFQKTVLLALLACLAVPAAALADDCDVQQAYDATKGPYQRLALEADTGAFSGGAVAFPTRRRQYHGLQSQAEHLRVGALRAKEQVRTKVQPSSPAGKTVKSLLLKAFDRWASAGRRYANAMVNATRRKMKKAHREWRLGSKDLLKVRSGTFDPNSIDEQLDDAEDGMDTSACGPVS
jgi:hypothetical protein